MRERYQSIVKLYGKEIAQKVLFGFFRDKMLFNEEIKFAAEINAASTVCKHYNYEKTGREKGNN